jgi:hypothetical protein
MSGSAVPPASPTKDVAARFVATGVAGPLTLIPQPEMDRIAAALRPLIDERRAAEWFYSAVSPDDWTEKPVETIYDAHRDHPQVRRLAEHPALADWAAALLGEPAKIWRTTFWIKADGARRVEWHQDTYKDEGLGSFPNVNAWIALDAATPENCLCFVPGTHREIIALDRFSKAGYVAQLRRSEALPPPPIDGTALVMPLKPGQCVFFDGKVLHGSPPNSSAARRAGLVVRFVPRDLELNHRVY